MSLISENLKNCSLKLNTIVAGVPCYGSGVIYQTPNKYHYNYVLTAKHLLSEDSNTVFEVSKLNSIKIEFFINGEFRQLIFLKSNEISINENLFIFENEDLAIIKIPKNEGISFPSILVTDELEDDELEFSSWSIFKANEDSLNHFSFDRSDPSEKRIELKNRVSKEFLDGFSGSGVFIHNKNILYGIISKYPNENFENSTIECSKITFDSINLRLASFNLIPLDNKASYLKREQDGKIVELYQAQINGAYLNLNLAIERVKTDMLDEWYYDSLQYIDLLKPDFLFAQFKNSFYSDSYIPCVAEKFYVPKNNFTLREAYILPLVDRIVYMAIVGELAPIIEDSLIPNVFASRYNRINEKNLLINGVEQWQKFRYKISEDLKLKNDSEQFNYNCILHVDILNYFDNIDKKLLIEKLKRIATNINQLKTIDLLNNFLSHYSSKSNGLPQNNDASALLATFYLNQVDDFMQNQTQAYFRFVDDIKILCHDKYEARTFLILLEKELKRCHLSVNSQKTKIIELKNNIETSTISENVIERRSLHEIYNSSLEKINALSKSTNYQNRNEAFHSAVKLLSDNLNSDGNENDEESRNLIFALRIIEKLCKAKIHFQTDNSVFFTSLKTAVGTLKDKPWITFQLCKILSLIESSDFKSAFLPELENLVLNEKFNLYPYQQFQVWLLLAKQKIRSPRLIQFASKKIEINDKTQIPTTSAQILYLSTVDKNFKRILFRKLNENFTDGYFQNRATLIALRSFHLVAPPKNEIHPSLTESFELTSKFGDKELVYYNDIEINNEDSESLEQLFSL